MIGQWVVATGIAAVGADPELKRLADWDSPYEYSLGLDGRAEITLERRTAISYRSMACRILWKRSEYNNEESKVCDGQAKFRFRHGLPRITNKGLPFSHSPFFLGPRYMFGRESYVGGKKTTENIILSYKVHTRKKRGGGKKHCYYQPLATPGVSHDT